MRELANRLRELRKENGLTIIHLSKEVGISKSAISQWETSTTDITGDNLIILAKYFKVSTDYLLGLED